MAKAAEKKANKKAKASPAKKAAAAALPKAAAKPISSKEIMAKAKQQVGICALLPPYMRPHHDIGKEVEVEGDEVTIVRPPPYSRFSKLVSRAPTLPLLANSTPLPSSLHLTETPL